MVRTVDGDGIKIKSNIIIAEVQKRACLFDSNDPNYGDRAVKSRCWQEVYESVVPGWSTLGQPEKIAAGKEVLKRWRSIRDSYTKVYRQGKCMMPEQCQPGSRRYQYHKQMAFLLKALQSKKPRYSQEKYDSFSELSNSPQHPPPEDQPKINTEVFDKPLDLKTKPARLESERRETVDKGNQAEIDQDKVVDNSSLEIKTDPNTIQPDDNSDDDRLFMISLLPWFKKMDADTRLLCRIELLQLIRRASLGNKSFETLRTNEDSFKRKINGVQADDDVSETAVSDSKPESKLSMTTRSANGSRPTRKRKIRSPSPAPVPTKKRGPGRPRKVRTPPSGSEEDHTSKKKVSPKKSTPVPESPKRTEDDSFNLATSVTQLSTPLFMKMYNLERSKSAPLTSVTTELCSDPPHT